MAYTSTEPHRLVDLSTIGRFTHQILRSIGRRFMAAIRLMQYGQMKGVLTRMPDEVLAEIGVARSEIPEHVRSMIYGDTD